MILKNGKGNLVDLYIIYSTIVAFINRYFFILDSKITKKVSNLIKLEIEKLYIVK